MVGSDTIPVTFTTNRGHSLTLVDTDTGIETRYFRVEDVDDERDLVTLLLLRPIDIYGEVAKAIADVVKLEKTTTKNTLSMMLFSGVQLLNPTLLTKKLVIEPKW